MELELSKWGDDSIRLAYWDSLHGNDRIWRFVGNVVVEVKIDEIGVETWHPVDLLAELRKLLETDDAS